MKYLLFLLSILFRVETPETDVDLPTDGVLPIEKGEEELEVNDGEDFSFDPVSLAIEEIMSSLSENEYNDALKKISLLLNDYPFALIDGQPVQLYLFEFFKNKPAEFKDLWTKNWTFSIQDFMSRGEVDHDLIFKLCFHSELKNYYQRLLPLLEEKNDFFTMALVYRFAQELNLETDQLYTLYTKKLESLQAPFLSWALQGWKASILNKDDFNHFKNLLLTMTPKDQYWPHVLRGDRPSSETKWSAMIKLDDQIKRNNQGQDIKPLIRYANNYIAYTSGQLKYVNELPDGSKQLWAIDPISGKVLWTHVFEMPSDGIFQCYYTAQGEGYHFDAVSWNGKPEKENNRNWVTRRVGTQKYHNEFVMRQHDGNVLWSTLLDRVVEYSKSWSLAGQPVLLRDGVYIPLADFSQVSSQGGIAFIYMLALDVHEGKMKWLQEVGELNFKRGVYHPHDPVYVRPYQDTLIVSTNNKHMFCVDAEVGRILWDQQLDPWYGNVGLDEKTNQQNMLFFGFDRHRNSDSQWSTLQSFFEVRENYGLLKEYASRAVFLINLGDGRVMDTFVFEQGQTPQFVQWLDNAALLLTKNEFSYIKNIDSNPQTVNQKISLPYPIKSVLSWGPGVLINTGYDIYEAFYDVEANQPHVRRVSDYRDDMELFACLDQLIQYNQNSVESLQLYPATIDGIRELWNSGERTTHLARILLSEIEQKDWESQINFFQSINSKLFEDRSLFYDFVPKILTFLKLEQKNKINWFAQYLNQKISDDQEVSFFTSVILNQETQNEPDYIHLAKDHTVDSQRFKKMVKTLSSKKQDGQVIETLSHIWKPIDAKKLKHIRDVTLPSRTMFYELTNQDWVRSSLNLFHLPSGEVIQMPASYLASNEKYIMFLQDNNPVVYAYRGRTIEGPLITIDLAKLGLKEEEQKKRDRQNAKDLFAFAPHQNHNDQGLAYYRFIHDSLFIQLNKQLLCFDLTTRKIKWKRKFRQYISINMSHHDDSYLYLVNNNQTSMTYIDKLDLETGYSFWSVAISLDKGRVPRGSKMSDHGSYFRSYGVDQWVTIDKRTGDYSYTKRELPTQPHRQQGWGINRQPLYYYGGDKLILLSLSMQRNHSHPANYYLYDKKGKLVQKYLYSFFSPYDDQSFLICDNTQKEVKIINYDDGQIVDSFKLPVSNAIRGFKFLGQHLYVFTYVNRGGKLFRLNIDRKEFEEVSIEGNIIRSMQVSNNFICARGTVDSTYFVYGKNDSIKLNDK